MRGCWGRDACRPRIKRFHPSLYCSVEGPEEGMFEMDSINYSFWWRAKVDGSKIVTSGGGGKAEIPAGGVSRRV